ncbi:GNAT family N-acetyltransferase [Saccharococcus thermophilus]|uniref:Ribosomal-protein-alanine N-acetyltransferase n=1 Tax=Saccharococcus thermophilus TaxID=29396 RepID=A0A846MGA8_9BACL|nr:GNAT family N-acetyltransferase [Saccharococcus thermophilus]NIK14793.1 ribosomal-protein-alanine N-acetyltransferase [Saccharococcus thermophilus]
MSLIETKRLQIIRFSMNCLEAAVEGKEALKKASGYDVAAEWPNRDYGEILPWLLEQWKKHPEQQKWSGLIVHKGNSMIIEEIGGKGAPDENGVIEIGYGIVPKYEGKGYATEAVRAFVHWLTQCPEVNKVVAECAKENIASKRVLEKAGFQLRAQDDAMLFWELKDNSPA